MKALRAAGGVELRVPAAGRVRHLLNEYPHLVADPEHLKGLLARIADRHGRRQLEMWTRQIDTGEWEALVESLLVKHYDPAYAASTGKNFGHVTEAVEVAEPTEEALERVAGELLAS